MAFFSSKVPDLVITWHIAEGHGHLTPRRATSHAMAFDLISPDTLTIPHFSPLLGVGSALVDTQVAVSLPRGYALVLRSRSGLANKNGVTVEAGEIDNDYCGHIKVLLFNHSGVDYTIEAGDRIAQARIVEVPKMTACVSHEPRAVDETGRGDKGFGSTGK